MLPGPFGGRIDDVRIYSRQLSAAEVFLGLATLPTGDSRTGRECRDQPDRLMLASRFH